MNENFATRQISPTSGVTDGTREAVKPWRVGWQCAGVGNPNKCTGVTVYLLGEMRFDRPKLIVLPHRCDACGSVKLTYWSLTAQIVRVVRGVPQWKILPEVLRLREMVNESTLPISRQVLEVIEGLEGSQTA